MCVVRLFGASSAKFASAKMKTVENNLLWSVYGHDQDGTEALNNNYKVYVDYIHFNLMSRGNSQTILSQFLSFA